MVNPPPFVVLNRTGGAFVEADEATTVELPGTTGDTVCAFSKGGLMNTTNRFIR